MWHCLLHNFWNWDVIIGAESKLKQCNCKFLPKNVLGTSKGLEAIDSALEPQCSTNLAMKTYMLGEGQ